MSQSKAPGQRGKVAVHLAANRLGVPSVIFFAMSAAAPLTAVTMVITSGYSVTGLIGIPVAFVVAGGLLALFSVGYVTMAPYVVNAGAFSAYISRGLGRPVGVAAALVALIAYTGIQIGVYGAIGDSGARLFRDWGVHVPWWLIALAGCALVAFLGLQHVDFNSKILAVLLVAEILVIVVYSLGNLAHPANGVVTVDALNPETLFSPGAGAVLAVAITAFVGFEASVVFSEEARQPGKTVRVATFTSIGVLVGLFTLASWAMSVATGPDRIVQASQTESTNLIYSLATTSLGTSWAMIGRALYVTGALATLIAFHNLAARYTFALGRERVLPAMFGRTSLRTGAPKNSSLVQSALALVVIVVYAVAELDPVINLFYWWCTSGALGVMLLIGTTSFAVIGFFAKRPSAESAWRRIVAPVLSAIGLAIGLVLVLANFDKLLGVEADSPLGWGIPTAYLVIAAVGLAWGLWLRGAWPEVYATIGMGSKAAIGRSEAEDGVHADLR
ncbi:APC family permease [Allokutzneria albata]|uniref:Amino acid transporter n=1 Tax=Allokutzneria albata TaxID=211114 RepID=A0A1G9RZB3_ALLAB|nr:APC family permease [Allokutzneria albata]SDM28377.1 Amino acid transporter [Allokutzneria albata]